MPVNQRLVKRIKGDKEPENWIDKIARRQDCEPEVYIVGTYLRHLMRIKL